MKRIVLVLVLTAVIASFGVAQIGIRNISSASADIYFNDDEAAVVNGGRVEKLALDLNQVLLFRITDWLSGEVKIQRQDEEPFASAAPDGWHETTISLAPIFIVTRYNYIIVRYGLGIGTGYERPAGGIVDTSSARGLSHDLTVDANYETARIFANLTLRGSIYPDLDYWFVLPATGFKYLFPAGFSLGGKYFFSYNSNEIMSHAFLGELEYAVTSAIRIKAGGSGSVTPSAPVDSRWSYTVLAGADFRVTETLALRYQTEFLGRQNAGPGIRNVLVLDARF